VFHESDDVDAVMMKIISLFQLLVTPNGLRYLRWGGDGEAVQPEKG
jgi:hypothetical protein